MQTAVYLENRQGGNPMRTHFVTLRAPGRTGATGAQSEARSLQEKSEGFLADAAFDELAEGASNDYLGHLQGYKALRTH